LELSQTINCHGSAPFKVWFMPIRWYDSTLYDISQELIDAVDYAVEENRESVSKYSGSSVIKVWSDGRVKVLRE